MILVVKDILETGTPYKPEGKNYTIHEWMCSGNIDGVEQKLLTVKAFRDINLEPGKEYQVEMKEYKGKKDYVIQSEKKPFQKSGYQRPTYTLQEYDLLWDHAIAKIRSKETNPELANSLISTYMISAIDSSVKVIENNAPQQEKTQTAVVTKARTFNIIQESLRNKPEKKAEFNLKFQKLGGFDNITDDQMQELLWEYGETDVL